MKRVMLIVFCLVIVGCLTAQNASEITRKVADNILHNTSFRFIDKKSGDTFTSTKNIPAGRSVSVESDANEWYYMNGVINIAMLKLAKLTNDKKYSDYSLRNFDFIFSNLEFFRIQYDEKVPESAFFQFFRLDKLDDCGAICAALSDVNTIAHKKEYQDYLQKAATYITTKQARLEDGTFARPEPRKMTLWADDLYMSVPFLSRMGNISGDPKYTEDAIKQVKNFTHYLFDPSTGLFYHCWYSDVKLNGVAHWGRCNGWIMLAQTELLDNLPDNHPEKKNLIKLLLKQIAGVSRWQDKTGLWHQVIDKPDSYLETSCTAMFVYSIARAVNEGWIDKSYFSIAENGWKGLLTKIQPDGKVQDICIGTGIEDNLKFYYDRPAELNDLHGLGAVILAGTEMMKSEQINK
jgi:unsaturated rhamnogalacturonyl hydrolase